MPSGSLGSLTISLEANTVRLEGDLGRAQFLLQKNAEQMQARAVAIGTAVGNAIYNVGKEVATKLAEIIPETIERMDKLSKAAEKVGLPTEEFSKLNYAASLADVQMDTLEKTLGKLTKSQAAALNTTSQQAKLFDALGISIKNADGSLRGSDDVLRQFADRFNELKGSPEAIAAGIAIFGRNFQEIIPLLKEGSAGLKEAGDEADRFGVTLSESAGKAAELANDNVKRLHSVFEGLAQEVVADLLPQINALLQWAIDFTADGANAANIAHDIAVGFGEMVTLGKDIAQVVTFLTQVRDVMNQIDAVSQRMHDATPSYGVSYLKEHFPSLYAQPGELLKNATASSAPSTFTGPASLQVPILSGSTFSAVPLNSYGQQSADATELGAALRGVFDGTEKVTKAQKAQSGAADQVKASYDRFEDTLGRLQGFLDGPLTKAEEQHKKNVRDLNDLAAKGKVSHEELAHALDVETAAYRKQQDEILSRYQTEIASLQGPLARAEDDHRLALREINQLVEEGQLSGEGLAAALKEQAKAYDLATAAARRQADPLGALLSDMQLEVDQIGLSNNERAVQNELLREGIDLYSKDAQAAMASARMLEQAAQTRQKNIQLMDTFRTDLADLGMTALHNFGQVGQSFKKMMDDIAQQIERRILENWINSIFGQQGTNGQGTSGGGWLGSLISGLFGSGSTNPNGYTDNAGPGANDGSFNANYGGGSGWASFFSGIFGLFGGGRADGGPTMRGRFYEVGELDRPEMYSAGGRSYLLPGNNGNVTPIRGGGLTQINNFNYAAPYDAHTESQKNSRLAFETKRAMARN